MNPPLAAKHTGMRVSADGLIGRIAKGAPTNKGTRYMLGEMLAHLHQAAEAYYAGRISVVDEFFQLYDLDDQRPLQPSAPSVPSVESVPPPHPTPTAEGQGDKSVAPPLSTLFPFEYATSGYFRAKGQPINKRAPLLHGMNAIRYLHAVMTGADPKPFLCSEKEGEL